MEVLEATTTYEEMTLREITVLVKIINDYWNELSTSNKKNILKEKNLF